MTTDAFHPAVARWFDGAFPGPTEAQASAWPAIMAGRNTLVAAPVMLLGLLIAYRSVGTAGTVVAALEAPFYALAIASALMARPLQATPVRRRRTGIVLSVIYGALFAITAVLQSVVATRTGMQGAGV